MPVIPNKLHFIWVGKPIPATYAENIVFWAASNRLYEVTLWTQHTIVDACMNELCQAYKRTFAHALPISARVKTTDYGLKVRITIDEMDSPAEQLISFNVHQINALYPLTDPAILAEELSEWKNYGAASDILRLWVIHEFGGIYMDTDTYSNGKGIPCGITAPHGFLIHVQEIDGKKTTITCIVASVKNSPFVKQMAERIEHNYTEYKTVGTGIVSFSDKGKKRLQSVNMARNILSNPKLAEDDKEPAKDLFYESFSKATMMRAQGIVQIPQHQIDDISFEIQSGYHPIIMSEGSWRPEGGVEHFIVYDPSDAD